MSDAILVTGGAGYVGSHTSMQLLQSERPVVVLDNLSTGHIEVVRLFEKLFSSRLFSFEHVDLTDGSAVRAVFDRHSIVGIVDFAAKSLVREGQEHPRDYFDTNVVGFHNLVKAARGLPLVKSSTAATYGNPEAVDLPLLESYQETAVAERRFTVSQLMPAKAEFDELRSWYTSAVDHPYELGDIDVARLMVPTNVYGITKLMDEIILEKRREDTGEGFACLRYFNVAGADASGLIGEDHIPETHLVPIVLQAALGNRERVSIFGDDFPTRDGTAVRDYISVRELGTAHVRVLDGLLAGNDSLTVNLGTRNGFTVKEIIEAARSVTGREIPCVVEGRRLGDPAMLVANPEVAHAELGWAAEEDLEQTIASAWQWHRNNPRGFAVVQEDRYNPFHGHWITFAASRNDRPWEGDLEEVGTEGGPDYDPVCYLCPGNRRTGGALNPTYDGTFVFPNDFPSLIPNAERPFVDGGAYRPRPAAGVCEVIVYSPHHSRRMAIMNVEEVAAVVDCWCDTYDRLMSRDDVACVLIFENRGAVMGNSQLHPHGQAYAYSEIPDQILAGQVERFAESDFVAEALAFEQNDGRRILSVNRAFTAFVPFAAKMPYDLVIVPNAPIPSLSSYGPGDRHNLAETLLRTLRGLDRLFGQPYHYSLALLQAPAGCDDLFHTQIHITSLLRGPGLRKHVVGADLYGGSINPSNPTVSAAEIRLAMRRAEKR